MAVASNPLNTPMLNNRRTPMVGVKRLEGFQGSKDGPSGPPLEMMTMSKTATERTSTPRMHEGSLGESSPLKYLSTQAMPNITIPHSHHGVDTPSTKAPSRLFTAMPETTM